MSTNKNSQRINDDAWWRVWWRRFRNDFSTAEPEKQVAQIYYITAVLAVLGSLLAGLWAFGEHFWPDKSATPIQKTSETAVTADPAPPPTLSIVALPFANLSGDPAQDYFADGITDSLTTDLSRALPGSFVVARETAFTFKGKPVDARQIGQSLHVRYVLEGSVLPVTNRADNSITVLSISGKDVKVTDTIAMGDSVAHVAISADGTKALAVKPVVNKVAFLKIDGQKVVYEKYDMPTGIFPYNVDIVPNGTIALVANNGAAGSADGNVDTVSVIDLAQNPPRVIDHVVVGDAPEGLAISPKGDLAFAILVAGNSNKKAFFSRHEGTAVVLKIDGKKVTKVGEIEVGGLAEGVAFSPDGAYAYIGNFLDSDISILKINGTQVTDTAKKVKLPGHPASLRSAPK